ncbi:Ectonucleoside triphosphate diphosphohydrolase [Seminavis robusta]|uniref:Ectonucleoside triphosphate diphosphohydrolase n=1 Tax=Seminavis robusta TaxID=568900 RepID=A0A9N8HFJ0_9STRA|nr:Ectonucleoside triphosphate diphosphohydrolase [Seminavis robusta]|eukprot:Sro352_g124130.1 Ectonucleoside triphosphate diphosphohydrolase (624) ;mRNA; f:12616-14487
MTDTLKKLAVEDSESWSLHLERNGQGRRQLKHHHHNKDVDASELELQREEDFKQSQRDAEAAAAKKRRKNEKKRAKRLADLYADPGIQEQTTHGMVIDAGSSGSRLHLYEWEPRVLRDAKDVEAAVSGRKLSFPGTETRWTERLRPGISTFSTITDQDELEKAIADYLEPLISFAESILHEKEDEFPNFRIYLRATAGMRLLLAEERARIMGAVRKLFANNTYCPFYFEDEQARTLSGEEEAIYDWLGVNFLSSNGGILQDSAGSGAVTDPKETFGALDLGGASTQISFYEPNEDIMANLFKLQVGQGKHWNVYTHSFLFYGINEATNRFEARLASGKSAEDRLVKGVYNPCLPGGSSKDIRTNIHTDENGMESWSYNHTHVSGSDYYQATLTNDNKQSDFEHCNSLVADLLHMAQNAWCNFDHRGDCSFAGIYQPKLPPQSERFGEFIAFSNYVHIWEFLNLPERASIAQLENATKHACSLSKEETIAFNNGRIDEDEVEQYCFRSVYALNLLRGYGFKDQDEIAAKKIINGHKVGWAIGSMLYEINTLPWVYEKPPHKHALPTRDNGFGYHDEYNMLNWEAFAIGFLVLFAGLLFMRRQRSDAYKYQYEPVKEVVSYQQDV